MSDSIKNVAIFGATGMTGQATLAQAVVAGEQIKPHTSINVPYTSGSLQYQGYLIEPSVIASERLLCKTPERTEVAHCFHVMCLLCIR